MLFWQMEMKGPGPEENACRDRAEKGAQILCCHPPHLLGNAKVEINRALAQHGDRDPRCAYALKHPPLLPETLGSWASNLVPCFIVRGGTYELWELGAVPTRMLDNHMGIFH